MTAAPSASLSVVVCGEALIDLIQQADGSFSAVTGGSPKNTATALARLGVPAGLVSRVGNDKFGNLIRTQLSESGVDLSLLAITKDPTTMAIASLDDSGSASYSFYINGCADGTWTVDELPFDFGDAKFVVIAGSLSLPIPAMSETFDTLFEREVGKRVVVFDPNIRTALIGGRNDIAPRMDKWISQSTIVKASSEDIAWRHPQEAIDVVAKRWLETGPVLVAVTDGAEGAHLITKQHAVWRPAPKVEVVDTVGAGDTFTAGLVEWLLSNAKTDPTSISNLSMEEMEAATDAAIRVASDTCTRSGANPPWRHELSA